MNSLHQQASAAAHRLRTAGIPPAEADFDARLLACEVLGWDTATYLTSSGEIPGADFNERYDALVSRREAREPMAYILGSQEFWGRLFKVTPAVLIPRPETELIVETVLELFPDRQAALSMADIGTGSGCLAVTLAAEFPNAAIIATDVSGPALAVAEHNARRLNVADRISFAQADVLAVSSTTFDLIVSNPPYVRDTDRQTLPPEVILHEPASSLFGGADGLSILRRVAHDAVRRLKPSGFLLVEFGLGQADQIQELISATAGLTMVALKRDLQGIPRTAVARATGPRMNLVS